MAAPYTPQKDHIDYAKLGDTGQDNLDAIAPITNAEPATHTNLRRAPENLRERTEDLRQFGEETSYYRDAQHLSLSSPGAITWGGTVADAGDGKITQADAITVKPFLTPRADTKGFLTVGTVAVNQITYTATATAWSTQRMNQVLVEHRDSTGAALTVLITDGPVKRIIVIFDAANTAHDAAAAKSAVDAAVAGDADLNTKLVVTINAAPLQPIDPIVETYIEGTAEAEAHIIAAGVLDSLTTTTPLRAGDTVAIWYRYLIDPLGGFDGRRESTSTHGNTNIPLAALFITSDEPSKIPGSIPLCTVQGNTAAPGTKLIWLDGSVFNKGDSFLLGGSAAGSLFYSGGPAWADATTNPANTVEGQLDKIVTDLGGGVGGTAKISGAALTATAPGNDAVVADSLLDQLQDLLDLVNKRADLTDTAAQIFAANIKAKSSLASNAALEGEALIAAVNADGVSGIGIGTGAGVRAVNTSVVSGYGLVATGYLAGSFTANVGGTYGIFATGASSFEGIQTVGGPSSGTGLRADGGGTNGKGIFAQGQGTGHGVDAVAGGNVLAVGVKGRGGSFVSGTGVWGVASNNGYGVLADGGTFNGTGLVAIGGVTGGDGIAVFSNGEGINVLCSGAGATNGINVIASGDGNGVVAVGGGGTFTVGVKGTGGAAGGAGVQGYGTGSGLTNVGVYGQASSGAGGTGVWGTASAASQIAVLGAGFTGIAHTGAGVQATGSFFGPGAATGGYGLTASGSLSCAPIHMVPQAQPTTFQEGDLYVDSSNLAYLNLGSAWRTIITVDTPPSITGDRSAATVAVLTDLLTSLNGLGIIFDNTTP